MTIETYSNLMRYYERRIARAQIIGDWEMLHEAVEAKAKTEAEYVKDLEQQP
jgi:uncharacterized protein YktA (UPF0223 family)